MSQKRDHFRIVFPVGQRPCLAAGLAEWDVIDLSENGAKVMVKREASPGNRGAFAATIRFHDGTSTQVSAAVQRREGNCVILSFAEPLAYPLIMGEQRRLLRLFPRENLVAPAAVTQQPISQPVTAAP
jgi:hypothetical protein